jgi:DNA-binding CsgD family transcriptional regulator
MTDDVATKVDISPSEMRVMKFVAQGLGYKATAAKLDLSVQTVKNEVSSVLAKLDAPSAIAAMVKLGWVSVPDLGNLQPNTFTLCGWVGTCGRPYRHRGNHGGFRAKR